MLLEIWLSNLDGPTQPSLGGLRIYPQLDYGAAHGRWIYIDIDSTLIDCLLVHWLVRHWCAASTLFLGAWCLFGWLAILVQFAVAPSH